MSQRDYAGRSGDRRHGRAVTGFFDEGENAQSAAHFGASLGVGVISYNVGGFMSLVINKCTEFRGDRFRRLQKISPKPIRSPTVRFRESVRRSRSRISSLFGEREDDCSVMYIFMQYISKRYWVQTNELMRSI